MLFTVFESNQQSVVSGQCSVLVRKDRGGQTSNRRESSMSIAGRRSPLRAWIDSFEVELEPPARLGPPRRSSSSAEAGASAGASGSTAPEGSAKEGSGLIRCRAIATRHLALDRKSTRLNSSHANISYAVFCFKKKKLHNH